MTSPEKPEDAWLERIREQYQATPTLEPEARKRLDSRLQSVAPPGRSPGFVRWWVERRTFTASPWALVAGVAALIVVGVWLGRLGSSGSSAPERNFQSVSGRNAPSDSTTVVRFAVSAPGASNVSLVGDFNGWDAAATPMREADHGVWSVSLPVSPGRHVYAFVVDHSRWVNDPVAPLAPEDGFGVPNSVIVVGWPGGV